MSSDPSRLVAALARDRINLDARALNLCFPRAFTSGPIRRRLRRLKRTCSSAGAAKSCVSP